MSFPGDDGYPGFKNVADGLSRFNVIAFIARQLFSGIATASLVQVKGVAPPSGVNDNIGTVDVQPMVNQIGGDGTPVAHGTIFALPYFRLQGGRNAVICDPQINDIGVAVFASRDISAAKKNRTVSNPGSRRQFDWADGLYLGGFLNGTPNQYVYFTSGGIEIVDANENQIVMDAAGVTINGVLIPRGGISFDLKTHTHDQPNDSHGDTEQPTLAPNDGS